MDSPNDEERPTHTQPLTEQKQPVISKPPTNEPLAKPTINNPRPSSKNSKHLIVEASKAVAESESDKAIFGQHGEAKIAIIIDDLGHQWTNGVKSIDLRGDYTLAILPFSPYSSKLALRAGKRGKEVMLHAPMEPIRHHAWDGGLSSEMSRDEIQNTLTLMLEDIPQAQGINNHMGSALTQNNEIMNWVMDSLTQKDLYFIDSLTTPNSTAYSAAQNYAIPSQKRDVFLDNDRSLDAMNTQLGRLLKLAHKHGSAIAICHPYPETLAFLEDLDAKLIKSGVRLVSISSLLSVKQASASRRVQPTKSTHHPASQPTATIYTKLTH